MFFQTKMFSEKDFSTLISNSESAQWFDLGVHFDQIWTEFLEISSTHIAFFGGSQKTIKLSQILRHFLVTATFSQKLAAPDAHPNTVEFRRN